MKVKMISRKHFSLLLAVISIDTSSALAVQPNLTLKTNVAKIAQRPIGTQSQVNVLNILLSRNLGESSPEEIAKRFAAKGLILSKQESRSNNYTGTRTILSLATAQEGVEQISLQFVSGNGNTTIEGIRAYFSPEEGLKEWMLTYIKKKISKDARLKFESADGATWMFPNGYIIWFNQDATGPGPNKRGINLAHELDQG
jgi:hypothetical protein